SHTVLRIAARCMNESRSAISMPRPTGVRAPGKLAVIVPSGVSDAVTFQVAVERLSSRLRQAAPDRAGRHWDCNECPDRLRLSRGNCAYRAETGRAAVHRISFGRCAPALTAHTATA